MKEGDKEGGLLPFRVFDYVSKGVDENNGFGLSCSITHFSFTTQFYAVCPKPTCFFLLAQVLLPLCLPIPFMLYSCHFCHEPGGSNEGHTENGFYVAKALYLLEGEFYFFTDEFPAVGLLNRSLLVVDASTELRRGQRGCCPANTKFPAPRMDGWTYNTSRLIF